MENTQIEECYKAIKEFEILSGRLENEFHIDIKQCEAYKIYTELLEVQKRLNELEMIRQEVLKATC